MKRVFNPLLALLLCLSFPYWMFSCIDRELKPDEDSPNYTDCHKSDDLTSSSRAVMQNKIWVGEDVKTWMSTTKPFKVECKKGSDSLVITFLGQIDTTTNNAESTIGFSLVLKENRITKFEQLTQLNQKVFSLNNSGAYVIFSDYFNTFYEQDHMKVAAGTFKFSSVFNVCGNLYKGTKAIKLEGSFNFKVDSANISIPVNGSFSFFMTPFDAEVSIGH